MTLLRFLFLPEAVGKATLHRLLINLSENSKTRTDLVSLLLSILADGSADLAAVDKGFSQLSLKAKGKAPATPRKPGPPGAPSTPGGAIAHPTLPGENVPNLVAGRCLEALAQLVNYNEQIGTFFLTENDTLTITLSKGTTPRNKKGKGKEKIGSTCKYPVVILLSLLERQSFLQNSVLMEQLMHLLSDILRPLTLLGKKPVDVVSPTAAPDAATATPATDTTAPASTEAPVASSSSSSAAGPNEAGPSTSPGSSSTARPAPEKRETPEAAKPEPELKPPTIPEQHIRSVVNVLTAGVCSSKTFQYTLAVIQYLSSLADNRDTIMAELADSAQRLGDLLVPDLDELMSTVTLAKFSPSSAQQAKLLRVLKTIDFMHTRVSNPVAPTVPASTAAVPGGAPIPAAVTAPPEASGSSSDMAVAPAVAAANAPAADPTPKKPDEKAPEESLSAIYDKLQFSKLWNQLGSCLRVIEEKKDLIHVATVLLPLIEAFMVVSKPYVLKKREPAAGPALARTSSKHAEATVRTNEELFVSFTEEHRKILNTMVRNNPSLMSGSFSLLVQNPKVLEFDNKRTYFNQQLRKRTTREHYSSLQINFVGRIIGKAIYDGRLLDCYFTRSFYKAMIESPVDYKDMEAIDPEFHKSL
ncbi:hypothetical protein BDK51DRAFT_33574, partial [Blyttiomyces helicus]